MAHRRQPVPLRRGGKGISFSVFYDEVSRRPAAVYVCVFSVQFHAVEKPEPVYLPWSLVAFPPSAGQHVRLHHFAVVTAQLV